MILKCESCGNPNLTRRGHTLVCETCGSRYELNADCDVADKTVTDARVLTYLIDAEKARQAENYTEEMRALTSALEIDPQNAFIVCKLGRCYRALGMSEKALDTYRHAIELDPDFGVPYNNMGTIYLLSERYREAKEVYEQGLPKIDKSQADYWTGYANYAVVLAKLGDPQRALMMVDEAEKHGYAYAVSARKLIQSPAGIQAYAAQQRSVQPSSSRGNSGSTGGYSGGSQSGEKKGCYVATCVYGSYDCPQVWTLRRFRDNTLAKSRGGRAFIRLYYAVSPKLVKVFGDTRLFRAVCKAPLDRLVSRLRAKGVQDTPYRDDNQ